MIDYRHSSSQSEVVSFVAALIKDHLVRGDRVLWLTSGGSAIDISTQIAKSLAEVDCSNLYISLVDERYGEIGHSNENWQQLLNSGFNIKKATLHRPLSSDSQKKTTENYNQWMVEQLKLSNFSLGLFGIGNDGHTAGLKPHSDVISSQASIASYSWSDYERITMTPKSITKLDIAVAQAFGRDKDSALHQLLTSNLPIANQPAQVLKSVNQSILYTDYKEESV